MITISIENLRYISLHFTWRILKHEKLGEGAQAGKEQRRGNWEGGCSGLICIGNHVPVMFGNFAKIGRAAGASVQFGIFPNIPIFVILETLQDKH